MSDFSSGFVRVCSVNGGLAKKTQLIKMKLSLGLLSTCFGKTFGLGENENRPGLCPELPNQENFQIERYLGQWFV